jgi:hypothetical protein
MPSNLCSLADFFGVHDLPILVSRYLLEFVCGIPIGDPFWSEFEEERWEDALGARGATVERVNVFHSVTLRYYSPIDPVGARGGQRKEIIRANPCYRGYSRHDCVLIETDSSQPGMSGLDVAQVLLVFSCLVDEDFIPMVLIQWFRKVSDKPDEDTGMWLVEREVHRDGSPHYSIQNLDCIFRSVHLLPVFGRDPVPSDVSCHDSLQVFQRFFVSPYSDHHIHEMLYEEKVSGNAG